MELLPLINFLWHGLGWPLGKLVFFISLGLLIGTLIESMNWTHGVARLASPLTRAGNLSDTTGASFSLAFFSSISANTMLADAYELGKISKKELVLANLFNSLPAYFLHMPTLFFIAVPLLGATAFTYAGLTILAAFSRTVLVVVLGRFFLASPEPGCVTCQLPAPESSGARAILKKTWSRFRQRIKKVLLFSLPIYAVIFILGRYGLFDAFETLVADHVSLLAWLPPQGIGIIGLQLAAEISAGLAAAGALLDSGSLAPREVILSLMVGNVLSSPMRAIRHQFPHYAGIFSPRIAVELITWNQVLRTGSIIAVTVVYFLATA